LRRVLQGVEQVTQLAQRLYGNHGPSDGEQTALRTKHPPGKRTEVSVRTFTDEMFSVPVFHSLHNTERHSKKGMPTIVNSGCLKNVRII
jgi:hypothetical protein